MSRGWIKIVAAILLVVLGSVGFVGSIYFTASSMESESVKLKSPGFTEVKVTEPGSYVVWHHFSTLFEGQSYNYDPTLPNGFQFSMVDEATGAEVEMLSGSNMTVSVNNDRRVSVGYFEITQPGSYLFSVESGLEQRVFSISPSSTGGVFSLVGVVFVGILLVGIAGVAAFVLLVWGLIQVFADASPKKPSVKA